MRRRTLLTLSGTAFASVAGCTEDNSGQTAGTDQSDSSETESSQTEQTDDSETGSGQSKPTEESTTPDEHVPEWSPDNTLSSDSLEVISKELIQEDSGVLADITVENTSSDDSGMMDVGVGWVTGGNTPEDSDQRLLLSLFAGEHWNTQLRPQYVDPAEIERIIVATDVRRDIKNPDDLFVTESTLYLDRDDPFVSVTVEATEYFEELVFVAAKFYDSDGTIIGAGTESRKVIPNTPEFEINLPDRVADQKTADPDYSVFAAVEKS